MEMNRDKQMERIREYEYVSFDVFDTLIKRNVQRPEDVYLITESIFNRRHPEQIVSFAKQRYDAEYALWNEQGKLFHIDYIYDRLSSFTCEQKAELRSIEFAVEKSVCQINKRILPILQYCRKKGKRIVVISDMYMTKEMIGELLSGCGAGDYYELFVSSETGLSKSGGTIYGHVVKKLGIEAKEMIQRRLCDGKKEWTGCNAYKKGIQRYLLLQILPLWYRRQRGL